MTVEDRALSIPDDVRANEASDQMTEIARIWWNVDHPSMIIRPALNHPGAVGAVLAELAWHFSQAYAEKTGRPQDEVFEVICKAWTDAHERAAVQRESAT